MHEGQLEVSVDTVRALVADQLPDGAGLDVRPVESHGTVNALFRIGEGLVARFPLQPGDVEEVAIQVEAEAAAARRLVGRTRFATPEPVAVGRPSCSMAAFASGAGADGAVRGFPLPWSVQTWLPGTIATDADPAASDAFARDLADLLLDLRAIDTDGRAFSGPGRGGRLDSQDPWMETCLERSRGLLDVPPLRRLWGELRTTPREDEPDVTCHGDLVPGNVLVADGRLTGVLDVGGLGPADPALDLVAAWHLLDPGPRAVLRDALGCHEDEWQRGRAWAFAQAMGLVWYYTETNPTMADLGRRTLARVAGPDR